MPVWKLIAWTTTTTLSGSDLARGAKNQCRRRLCACNLLPFRHSQCPPGASKHALRAHGRSSATGTTRRGVMRRGMNGARNSPLPETTRRLPATNVAAHRQFAGTRLPKSGRGVATMLGVPTRRGARAPSIGASGCVTTNNRTPRPKKGGRRCTKDPLPHDSSRAVARLLLLGLHLRRHAAKQGVRAHIPEKSSKSPSELMAVPGVAVRRGPALVRVPGAVMPVVAGVPAAVVVATAAAGGCRTDGVDGCAGARFRAGGVVACPAGGATC